MKNMKLKKFISISLMSLMIFAVPSNKAYASDLFSTFQNNMTSNFNDMTMNTTMNTANLNNSDNLFTTMNNTDSFANLFNTNPITQQNQPQQQETQEGTIDGKITKNEEGDYFINANGESYAIVCEDTKVSEVIRYIANKDVGVRVYINLIEEGVVKVNQMLIMRLPEDGQDILDELLKMLDIDPASVTLTELDENDIPLNADENKIYNWTGVIEKSGEDYNLVTEDGTFGLETKDVEVTGAILTVAAAEEEVEVKIDGRIDNETHLINALGLSVVSEPSEALSEALSKIPEKASTADPNTIYNWSGIIEKSGEDYNIITDYDKFGLETSNGEVANVIRTVAGESVQIRVDGKVNNTTKVINVSTITIISQPSTALSEKLNALPNSNKQNSNNPFSNMSSLFSNFDSSNLFSSFNNSGNMFSQMPSLFGTNSNIGSNTGNTNGSNTQNTNFSSLFGNTTNLFENFQLNMQPQTASLSSPTFSGFSFDNMVNSLNQASEGFSLGSNSPSFSNLMGQNMSGTLSNILANFDLGTNNISGYNFNQNTNTNNNGSGNTNNSTTENTSEQGEN